jgi:hypothetical protein
MRKGKSGMECPSVLVTYWIPKEISGDGLGKWSEPTNGAFHMWGNECNEDERGFTSFTVGIVELEDGTVVTTLPSKIKFVD